MDFQGFCLVIPWKRTLYFSSFSSLDKDLDDNKFFWVDLDIRNRSFNVATIWSANEYLNTSFNQAGWFWVANRIYLHPVISLQSRRITITKPFTGVVFRSLLILYGKSVLFPDLFKETWISEMLKMFYLFWWRLISPKRMFIVLC